MNIWKDKLRINDEYNDGFEDWEEDHDLIQKNDWNGLLKLRKQRAH